jgi:hypothetical protein
LRSFSCAAAAAAAAASALRHGGRWRPRLLIMR